MARASINPSARCRIGVAASLLALLTACGGGNGASPVSTPRPTPTPTPTPTPPPTNFDTEEFRFSTGPEQHGAIAAWEDGFTGDDSIIAIVDTGIDSDSPEFAGRIHPDSADVAGNRGIDGEDDHGTNVAMVAAAARDDTGVLGIAFDAQVLAIRADEPGSCGTDTPQDASLSCLFADTAIAAGVDLAVNSGAKVVNLSLGGGGASQVLLDAVARASAAGVVVVVAAGNSGDGSDPNIPADQPDPFAISIRQAGGDNVIIVGSVDADGNFSGFSNQAGNESQFYLTARGEQVCCVYDEGELFVETINGQEFVTVFSGTSFSAPQVAGAVALLAQAFPNLTGQEIVEILLESAADAGATGTDVIFGRGILDIAAAFEPAGTTTLAGDTARLPLSDRIAVTSPAMGDALGSQGLQTIVTDKYNRAYRYELSSGFDGSSVMPRLRGAVEQNGRQLSLSLTNASLAFHVSDGARAGSLGWSGSLRLSSDDAERARVLAARVATRISPDLQLGLAFAQNAEGLVAQLQGHSKPAFRIAPGTSGDSGFFAVVGGSLALRQDLGSWGVTFHAEESDARLSYTQRFDELFYGDKDRFRVRTLGISADRRFGALAGTLGMSWMHEEHSILGAQLHPAIGRNGADTLFADGSLRWDLGSGWEIGGEARVGVTRAARGDVITDGSQFISNAWALDVSLASALMHGDSLGLRISQPLRVEVGGLRLNLPSSFNYSTETAGYSIQPLSLAPNGRELVGEMSWQLPLLLGVGGASVFYRHEPGHYANSQSDIGAMISFSADF